MQTRSSMGTSINTSKLPSVWGKLNWNWINNHFQLPHIVDYGCGRPATVRKVMIDVICQSKCRAIYFPYDPYWGDIDKNRNAISCLTQWQTADICVCANVLNVIDDVDTIKQIIKEVTQAKYWVFQIYEGNKTGCGKETKVGCWQHNKLTKDYCWIFNEVLAESGQSYYIKGNLIMNHLDLLK